MGCGLRNVLCFATVCAQPLTWWLTFTEGAANRANGQSGGELSVNERHEVEDKR